MLISIFLFFSFTAKAGAMGKTFSEQGRQLSILLNRVLISKGMCESPPDCFNLLPGFTDHDDRVRINYYEVGNQNFAAFLEVIDFVLKDGLNVTDGTPITITAHRETHNEVRKSGIFIKNVKPFMTLEVNK